MVHYLPARSSMIAPTSRLVKGFSDAVDHTISMLFVHSVFLQVLFMPGLCRVFRGYVINLTTNHTNPHEEDHETGKGNNSRGYFVAPSFSVVKPVATDKDSVRLKS
jgi:hypothetical protein